MNRLHTVLLTGFLFFSLSGMSHAQRFDRYGVPIIERSWKVSDVDESSSVELDEVEESGCCSNKSTQVEPYTIVTKINETWYFGLFGEMETTADPAEFLGGSNTDAEKYLKGKYRTEKDDRELLWIGCVENPLYKGVLSEEEKTRAKTSCLNKLELVKANLDWTRDYQVLDLETESALLEAVQDTLREIQVAIYGNYFCNASYETAWRGTFHDAPIKLWYGTLSIVKVPFKLVIGALTTVAGIVAFPFEDSGHHGDFGRRAIGYTLKAALDPITATIVILDSTLGTAAYVVAAGVSPIFILGKEAEMMVREATRVTTFYSHSELVPESVEVLQQK